MTKDWSPGSALTSPCRGCRGWVPGGQGKERGTGPQVAGGAAGVHAAGGGGGGVRGKGPSW